MRLGAEAAAPLITCSSESVDRGSGLSDKVLDRLREAALFIASSSMLSRLLVLLSMLTSEGLLGEEGSNSDPDGSCEGWELSLLLLDLSPPSWSESYSMIVSWTLPSSMLVLPSWSFSSLVTM